MEERKLLCDICRETFHAEDIEKGTIKRFIIELYDPYRAGSIETNREKIDLCPACRKRFFEAVECCKNNPFFK